MLLYMIYTVLVYSLWISHQILHLPMDEHFMVGVMRYEIYTRPFIPISQLNCTAFACTINTTKVFAALCLVLHQ